MNATGTRPAAPVGRNDRVLVVATLQQWRSSELAEMTLPGWSVLASLGLDVPLLDDLALTRWWTPQEHAVHLRCSGVDLALVSVGPDWLAGLPARFVKRDVWVGRIEDVAEVGGDQWFKPASMKHRQFPAMVTSAGAVTDMAARAAQRPPSLSMADMWVQACGEAGWVWEARCWVREGHVLDACVYLDHAQTWDPRWPVQDVRAVAAQQWCQKLLDAGVGVPDGIVIDVGWSADAGFSVVEANPAWASSWYGTGPDVVASVLDVCVDWEGHHRRWAYEPDPVLVRAMSARRPLPWRKPWLPVPVSC